MIKIIFSQPHLLSADLASQCVGKVLVLDIAFDNRDFQNTTLPFINTLGDRLTWVDHHDNIAWADFLHNPCFILVPRAQAPACPPIITPQLVAQIGTVDTIIVHGDIDGIYALLMFLSGGRELYQGMVDDAIACDTGNFGDMSPVAERFNKALKADLRNDATRYAIVASFVETGTKAEDAQQYVQEQYEKYEEIEAETVRLTETYTVSRSVSYLDATLHAQSTFDLTSLLKAGQENGRAAVIRNTRPGSAQAQITIAGDRNLWNFVDMFGLTGGTPNYINLPDQDMLQIVEHINTSC